MYLSFFIKPETDSLKKIKELLEKSNFSVKSSGRCEEYRIVFFNGPDISNFCYTGHKLFRNPPEGITSPFLIKVGNAWTMQGLLSILKNYARFQLPYLDSMDFPQEKDFERKGLSDKRLIEKLNGMEETAKNCNANKREVRAIREIKSGLKKGSVGEVKEKIFYFLLIEKKIVLPWGDLPAGKEKRGYLVRWLEKANKVFLENKDINRRYAE